MSKCNLNKSTDNINESFFLKHLSSCIWAACGLRNWFGMILVDTIVMAMVMMAIVSTMSITTATMTSCIILVGFGVIIWRRGDSCRRLLFCICCRCIIVSFHFSTIFHRTSRCIVCNFCCITVARFSTTTLQMWNETECDMLNWDNFLVCVCVCMIERCLPLPGPLRYQLKWHSNLRHWDQ